MEKKIIYIKKHMSSKVIHLNRNDPTSFHSALMEAVVSMGASHDALVPTEKVEFYNDRLSLYRPETFPAPESLQNLSWDQIKQRLVGLVCAVEGMHQRRLSIYTKSPVALEGRLALSDYANLVRANIDQQRVQSDLEQLVESLMELIARSLVVWLQQDGNKSNIVSAVGCLKRLGDLVNVSQGRLDIQSIRQALEDTTTPCKPVQFRPRFSEILDRPPLEDRRLEELLRTWSSSYSPPPLDPSWNRPSRWFSDNAINKAEISPPSRILDDSLIPTE